MKRLTSNKQTMLGLILLLATSLSCASYVVPKLDQRTLRISKDFAGFEYRYCGKHHWLTRKCKEWVVDKYDLNDVKTRNRLIDMGFVAKVRKRY